jgi:hypothetical protein
MTYISCSEGVFLFLAEKYRGILSITVFNIPTFHVLRIPFDVPKYVVFCHSHNLLLNKGCSKTIGLFCKKFGFS